MSYDSAYDHADYPFNPRNPYNPGAKPEVEAPPLAPTLVIGGTPVPAPAANPIEAMAQFQDEMIRLCEMYSRKVEEHAAQRDKFAELYHQATTACDAITNVLTDVKYPAKAAS